MTLETGETIVEQNPAVQVAKEAEKPYQLGFHSFSTGVRGRLKSVAPSLIDTVVSKVKEPKVPNWHNPDKDRDEPNPADPDYLQALDQYNHDRGVAAMDAMAMFGVQLESGLPEDESWIDDLSLLEIVVNREDTASKTFAYKRYIAVGQPEIDALLAIFQGGQGGIAGAMSTFRR